MIAQRQGGSGTKLTWSGAVIVVQSERLTIARATMHGSRWTARAADLVHQAVDLIRLPAVRSALDRCPWGNLIQAVIEGLDQPPIAGSEPASVEPAPRREAKPQQVKETVHPEPPTAKQARRPSGKPAVKPPVPPGTRVRMLTGKFQGWTGPLRWSPAKAVYNARLTSPDGQRTRTTLSPSTLGATWKVDGRGEGATGT